MTGWLSDWLAADPTAPDEWLNRAAAAAVLLIMALAIHFKWSRSRDAYGDPWSSGWRAADFMDADPTQYASHPEIP